MTLTSKKTLSESYGYYSWVCLWDETLSLGDRILKSQQEHLQGQVQTSNHSCLDSSFVRSGAKYRNKSN